ncbi:MAG: Crp/Fnr family transcriptional regulator [Clostridia bacterium]
MKDIFEILKNNSLFIGIGIEDFYKILSCIGAQIKSYRRGDVVFFSGNLVSEVGLVLSGRVKVMREAADGNSNILTELYESEMFGETFACAGIDHIPVTVLAAEDCEILFLNYRKIIGTCASSCAFHTKLIENMLMLLAQKNLFLNRKIEILSKRSTRERLLLFFDLQRGVSGKFTIPYNREELAAMLCVERSAMSAELSRMQADGLIRFQKNEFELL